MSETLLTPKVLSALQGGNNTWSPCQAVELLMQQVEDARQRGQSAWRRPFGGRVDDWNAIFGLFKDEKLAEPHLWLVPLLKCWWSDTSEQCLVQTFKLKEGAMIEISSFDKLCAGIQDSCDRLRDKELDDDYTDGGRSTACSPITDDSDDEDFSGEK